MLTPESEYLISKNLLRLEKWENWFKRTMAVLLLLLFGYVCYAWGYDKGLEAMAKYLRSQQQTSAYPLSNG